MIESTIALIAESLDIWVLLRGCFLAGVGAACAAIGFCAVYYPLKVVICFILGRLASLATGGGRASD